MGRTAGIGWNKVVDQANDRNQRNEEKSKKHQNLSECHDELPKRVLAMNKKPQGG